MLNEQEIRERIVRRPEVNDRTGLPDPTIDRLEKDGLFPKRRRIGVRAVGWLESELVAWMRTRDAVALASGEEA